MSILDISKLIMYQYHYDYLMPKYPGTKLMFTDTDSLCYWIPSDRDIYEDIKGNNEWFDFSNYSTDHPNYDDDCNILQPGYMKDEMGGLPILEFVGLRSKMYSILQYNQQNKKTAKGVISYITAKKISHEDYKTSLEQRKRFIHSGYKIRQDRHQLKTSKVTKTTLSPFNDKKYIYVDENGEFKTYSFGNKNIL